MLPTGRFTHFIAQNQLFNSGNRVLAAVSGGMDSVLMAHLLHAAGYPFDIAHCNFQLRGPEADADQAFCRELARGLKAGFHTINFDTTAYAAQHKISIQMAARALRYQWFDDLRVQNAYSAVALAHHQNDAIETILLNLTRGTGIAGLHGILPKNGTLVRPMLFMKRQEIESLVSENHIAYVEDSSNASAKYARNKIRLEVVPKLKELNPSLEETFEGNLRHFRELEVLLEAEVSRQREHFTAHNDELHLPIDAVKNLHPQRLLLFSLLKPYGFNEEHVDSIIASLDKHSGRVFETAEYTIVLDRGKLILRKKTNGALQGISINEDSAEIIYGGYRLSLLHDDRALIVKNNPMAASVNADLLVYPLMVRPWQTGDYFYPLGMASKQKLSDFFVHQKVPLHQKSGIPVLLNGNGEVVWIGGYRLDNRYKVSGKTKKVTIFELYKML
ncbi:MAG: tRNA lysidine(34) synthetase TilS [Bacteroidota bacterium]